MISILIADDNRISLKYFSELVPWEEYGYCLAATAIDGEDAWEKFQKFVPQVVVTDIQMPVMSGIQLAERIMKEAPDTVIVFLSSYSEFKYAQAALQLKVYGYLLKHETEKDMLVDQLQRIRQQIVLQSRQNRLLAKQEWLEIQNHAAAGQGSWGSGTTEHLRLRYHVYLVEQNHILPVFSRRTGRMTPPVREMDFDRACGLLEENAAVIQTGEYRRVILMKPTVDPMQAALQLRDTLERQLDRHFSVVLLGRNMTAFESAETFWQLSPSFDRIWFYPASSVLDQVYLQSGRKGCSCVWRGSSRPDDQSFREMESVLMELIVAKDAEGFCVAADAALSQLFEYHQQAVQFSSGRIFLLDLEHGDLVWRDAFLACQWLVQQYQKLVDFVRGQEKVQYSELINKTIHYIHQHYTTYELSLEQLAEAMNVSVSGLNAAFKRETGYTVWKVIVKIRMEYAKQLLDQEKYSVTDICSMVGYNSLSYFSKAFRTTYGISPQEYRRQGSEDTKMV